MTAVIGNEVEAGWRVDASAITLPLFISRGLRAMKRTLLAIAAGLVAGGAAMTTGCGSLSSNAAPTTTSTTTPPVQFAAQACDDVTTWLRDMQSDQLNRTYHPTFNQLNYMSPDTNPPTVPEVNSAVSSVTQAARADQRWTPLAEAMIGWFDNSTSAVDGMTPGDALIAQCTIATGHSPMIG
jgi:hypothetical protein